jgi:hypothetical protein
MSIRIFVTIVDGNAAYRIILERSLDVVVNNSMDDKGCCELQGRAAFISNKRIRADKTALIVVTALDRFRVVEFNGAASQLPVFEQLDPADVLWEP